MQIKKILCLLLCLTVLIGALAGCGNQETPDPGSSTPPVSDTPPEESTSVDEEIEQANGHESAESILCIPLDKEQWLEENKSDYMDFELYFSDLSWKEDDYDALADYINLLCTEYDFEQVGQTYYEFIWDTAFFDMVLRYTGEKSVEGDYAVGTHSENVGDLQIFGTIDKYGQLECNFQCDKALQGGDDGYRYGQTERINAPEASMGINLIYKDGVFQTQYEDLFTTLGKACILEDGQRKEYPARYEIDLDEKRLTVYVENDYGDAIQCFYVPTLTGWRTDVYPASEFIIRADYAEMARGVENDLPNKTWERMFAAAHNGSYVYPVTALSGEMSGLDFRVLYQDSYTMVFYTRAEYCSAPKVVEALIAVNTDVEPVSEEEQASSGGSSSEKCGSCFGSGDCRSCGGDGYYAFAGEEKACGSCGSTGNCGYCEGTGKK